MDPHGSVTRMILDLRSDEPAVRNAAARLIWERYFRDLLTLARKNLDKRIRLRTDEEDVAQSMFKSFCLRQQRGEFDLAGRDELWRLLVTITIRKARNAAKAQRRDKRDIARDQTLPIDDERQSAYWALRLRRLRWTRSRLQIGRGSTRPRTASNSSGKQAPARGSRTSWLRCRSLAGCHS